MPNPSTKNKYEALDTAILARLKEGAYSFSELGYFPIIRAETSALATEHNRDRETYQHTLSFRFLDRRLQALRKKGLIEVNHRKWKLKTTS